MSRLLSQDELNDIMLLVSSVYPHLAKMTAFEPDLPPAVVFRGGGDDDSHSSDGEDVEDELAWEPIADTMADIVADSHRRTRERVAKKEKLQDACLKETAFDMPGYGRWCERECPAHCLLGSCSH
jgi:hypothetical protein